jgi:uncharacterized BrkB/YihY/UPF0761 family membrane protein
MPLPDLPEPRPVSTRGSALLRGSRWFLPTLKLWWQTEIHVYGFAIAANVLLSFFPFLIVMVSLFRYVFHWQAAVDATLFTLELYFPDDLGGFLRRNLMATVDRRGPMQWVSIALLLFTANGVFVPMEVALNRIWRIQKDRSMIANQAVSLALIFGCGTMALLSTMFTALNQQFLKGALGGSPVTSLFAAGMFKMAAVPLMIALLFAVYQYLPNGKEFRPDGKLPWRRNLAAAIVVGLLLEALQSLNLLLWPWLYPKLALEYGPFKFSVSLLLLGYIGSLLVLAGAEWASRIVPPARPHPQPEP